MPEARTKHVFRHLAALMAVVSASSTACTRKEATPSTYSKKPPTKDGTERRVPGKEPTVEELGGPRGTLVRTLATDPGSLLPVVAQSAADYTLTYATQYSSVGVGFDCRLTFQPQLYEAWKWNPEHTSVTVEIRRGLQWSDGVEITAEDVAFGFQLMGDPDVASPRISAFKNLAAGKGVEVLGSHKLRINFKQRYNPILMMVHAEGVNAHPRHALMKVDRKTLRGHPLARDPLANGPWKITKREPGSRVILEPNERFMGPTEQRPRLERIIFKILPEYSTRLLELENGSVDHLASVEIRDAERLVREHPEIRIHRRGWRFLDYIAWNNFDPKDYRRRGMGGKPRDWEKIEAHPLFGDRDVRRALGYAIDEDKLIEDLLTSKTTGERYGRFAVSTVTPSLCDYSNDDLKPLGYSRMRAVKLLEEAGWSDSDGDGVLDKDGRPFTFPLLIEAGQPRVADAAIIVQDSLKKVGIQMDIQKLEANAHKERLRNKDYDAALSSWSSSLFVEMNTLWHSGEEYQFNYTGYRNPKADELMERALTIDEMSQAAALWKQAQEIIYGDQPYAFLYWRDDLVALHERFENAQVNIISTLYRPNTWWVAEGREKY